jgi:hypothetical protein
VVERVVFVWKLPMAHMFVFWSRQRRRGVKGLPAVLGAVLPMVMVDVEVSEEEVDPVEVAVQSNEQ